MAGMDPVNVDAMLARFSEHWPPKKIAQINDYDVRIVKLQGDFTWHKHDDTEELFLVLSGELTIQMRDRNVVLGPRDLFVVPRASSTARAPLRRPRFSCWSPAASSTPAMLAESSPPRLKRCPEDQSAA
jgi:cupin domain